MASPQIEAAAASQRTESEVRAARSNITMLDTIRAGAARQRPQDKSCPWCAADPLPAVKVCGRYVVACENEDCKIDVQAAGETPEEAWKIWNARP